MSDDFSYPSQGRIHSQPNHGIWRRGSWWADFLTAATFLTWMAVGISAFAVLASLERHRIAFPEYGGITIWNILESYWLAALIGVLPLMFLMPLTRFRWGHGLAGYVLAFIFYFVVAWRLFSHDASTVVLAFILGFGGFGVGIVTFDDEHGNYLSSDAKAARVTKLAMFGLVIIGIVWAVLNPPFCLFPTYCHR